MWCAWSVLVPDDYHDDRENRRFQIMGQFHDMPNFAAGETWASFPANPPMVSIQYGYDEQGSGSGLFYGLKGRRRRVAVRYIEKGRWYDVTLHIRWSRTDKGFVEAWPNGEPWTPFNGRDHRLYGPNMTNDQPPLLKLGRYRDFGFTASNTVYCDHLRLDPTRRDLAP